jgi:hypothetical protein
MTMVTDMSKDRWGGAGDAGHTALEGGKRTTGRRAKVTELIFIHRIREESVEMMLVICVLHGKEQRRRSPVQPGGSRPCHVAS